MESSLLAVLILQFILIALNAVFACAEIAVLSISETKLEKMAEEGSGKARRLMRLTKEPAKFLATIQVAITLSGFLGSAFAADSFSEPLVDWVLSLGVELPRATLDTVAVILITLVLSYFTLVFGELVPKRIAMKESEKIALGISGLVGFISGVFKPLVWLLSVSTNLVLRLFGIDPNEEDEEVSEEEIRMLVDAGSEKGTIDHHEKEIIQNVFEFNDIVAGDVATHRTDVVLIDAEDDIEEWDKIIHESRFSYYPVFEDTPDNIVGILDAKDYFRLKEKNREKIMAEAVHPAYFVPELIKADVLFNNMKKTGNSIAVVVDEYGGMVGIVKLNDLIEELVGELSDTEEEKSSEPHVEAVGENSWRIYGNMKLADIEEETALELVSEDFETFTGLVFDSMGKIPDDGECSIDVEIDNMEIHINRVEAHQIVDAILTAAPKEDEDDGEEDD